MLYLVMGKGHPVTKPLSHYYNSKSCVTCVGMLDPRLSFLLVGEGNREPGTHYLCKCQTFRKSLRKTVRLLTTSVHVVCTHI